MRDVFHPMNRVTDGQVLEWIKESRRNLGTATVTLTRLSRQAPKLARRESGVLSGLIAEQKKIEDAAGIQGQQFGLFWIPIFIVGGMSLLGLGTWVYKQKEQTAFERQRLELMEKCIQDNTAAGYSSQDAESRCLRIYGTGSTTLMDLSTVLKSSLLLVVGVTAAYLIIRWKT